MPGHYCVTASSTSKLFCFKSVEKQKIRNSRVFPVIRTDMIPVLL